PPSARLIGLYEPDKGSPILACQIEDLFIPPAISHGDVMHFVVEKSLLVGEHAQQVRLDIKPYTVEHTALGAGDLQIKIEDRTHLVHGSLYDLRGLHGIAFHHAALKECGYRLLSLEPDHAVLILSRRQSKSPAVRQCVDPLLIGPGGCCHCTVLKVRHQVAQGKIRLERLVALPAERGTFNALPTVVQVDSGKQSVT